MSAKGIVLNWWEVEFIDGPGICVERALAKGRKSAISGTRKKLKSAGFTNCHSFKASRVKPAIAHPRDRRKS